MKRFKDCELFCLQNQKPHELLDIVMQISKEKGYEIDRYSTFRDNDTLAVYAKNEKSPYSRIIICTKDEANVVKIVNIVPLPESGFSQIEPSEYNKILRIFRDSVFVEIANRDGNVINETPENYTINDIIPLSAPVLHVWLGGYPLSRHPLDEIRWYDFVIALHRNKEHLSSEVFENFIRENYHWDENDIEEFSSKLVSQLDLLEYYEGYR